jgi:hypothetical protein
MAVERITDKIHDGTIDIESCAKHDELTLHIERLTDIVHLQQLANYAGTKTDAAL